MLLTDKASSPPSPTLFSPTPLQQPALYAFADAPVSRAQVVTRPQTPTPCERREAPSIDSPPALLPNPFLPDPVRGPIVRGTTSAALLLLRSRWGSSGGGRGRDRRG